MAPIIDSSDSDGGKSIPSFKIKLRGIKGYYANKNRSDQDSEKILKAVTKKQRKENFKR